MFIIILGALVPSIMLVYLIYRIDRFLEPAMSMIAAFLTGMLSPILTIYFSSLFNLGVEQGDHPWIYAFSMAALPEELGRLLILLWICNQWKAVGEPFDCLVYGATVWAGFAATENILYAFGEIKSGGSPIYILSIRASLCTMGHTAWGVIMGAYIALARYSAKNRNQWLVKGLIVTTLLHLFYDGLLMSVPLGHPFLKIAGAISVDAFSLILATVILIRMRAIQGISESEGDERLLQTELFKRHTPESSAGIFEIVTQLGFFGIIKIMLAMGMSSLGLGLLLNAISNLNWGYCLWGLGLLYLGFMVWKSVLKIAYSIHLVTASDLSQEIETHKKRKRSLKALWTFRQNKDQ